MADRIKNMSEVLQTKIGVQPTAVARRKAALGGRSALITGRPEKGANIQSCAVLQVDKEVQTTISPPRRSGVRLHG